MKDLFLTVCSNNKNNSAKTHKMKMTDLYTGNVFKQRFRLLDLISPDGVYISSLMGAGIVRDDFEYNYYMHNPPTEKEGKDFKFMETVRDTFISRYPEKFKNTDRIFFLGSNVYKTPLEYIFRDKELVICLAKKIRVGQILSLCEKTYNQLIDNKPIKRTFVEYQGYVIVWNKYKEGIDCQTFIKQDENTLIELNPFDDEYKTGVALLRELTHYTIDDWKKEFPGRKCPNVTVIDVIQHIRKTENVETKTDLEAHYKNIIPVDYINNSGVWDERFAEYMNNWKKNNKSKF